MENNELAYLADIIIELGKEGVDSIEELRKAYDKLPEHIKKEAEHWGLADTVVRDNIYEHIRDNKEAFFETS